MYKLNQVVYWVRSRGPGNVKDRVPMYYRGLCRRADEGIVGEDIRVRPVWLGKGAYTCTVSADDIETE